MSDRPREFRINIDEEDQQSWPINDWENLPRQKLQNSNEIELKNLKVQRKNDQDSEQSAKETSFFTTRQNQTKPTNAKMEYIGDVNQGATTSKASTRSQPQRSALEKSPMESKPDKTPPKLQLITALGENDIRSRHSTGTKRASGNKLLQIILTHLISYRFLRYLYN